MASYSDNFDELLVELLLSSGGTTNSTRAGCKKPAACRPCVEQGVPVK